MADNQKDEPEQLAPDDWVLVAAFIKDELDRRVAKRRHLESIWKEVDRQVAMKPLPRKVHSGRKTDWYPELELSWQANALEVIAADARRLKFPFGSSWYQASANLTDEYLTCWSERRERFALFGSQPFPLKLDQETADTLPRAVLDYYHKLYDFEQASDLLDADAIKYGTFVGRIREVRLPHFEQEFRGVRAANKRGPALIPCSIKETYLDDSTVATMHEGEWLGPAIIRRLWQMLDDVKRAAQAGGKERGWLVDEVMRLESKRGKDDKRGQVELVHYEGDLLVPRVNAAEAIFLPNSHLTVIVVGGGPAVVRYQQNDYPFRSYVPGWYMREDVSTPYGVSPLMKGQPLQEAASSALNDLMAVSALNARPPIAWDRNDPTFTARGGPEIFPGAEWGTDRPDLIKAIAIGDPSALTALYLALAKQFEDVTGVNDPRRGQTIKSHTTEGAHQIEAARTIVRTDDFVRAVEMGPLTTMLYMEWEIAKRLLRKPQAIPVNAAGIEGWVNIAKDDLADEVSFTVLGSGGANTERERLEKFMVATKAAVELVQLSVAMGKPVDFDFVSAIIEVYTRAGIQDGSKYAKPVGTAPGALSAPVPGAGAAPGAPGGVPANGSQGVQAGPVA